MLSGAAIDTGAESLKYMKKKLSINLWHNVAPANNMLIPRVMSTTTFEYELLLG